MEEWRIKRRGAKERREYDMEEKGASATGGSFQTTLVCPLVQTQHKPDEASRH